MVTVVGRARDKKKKKSALSSRFSFSVFCCMILQSLPWAVSFRKIPGIERAVLGREKKVWRKEREARKETRSLSHALIVRSFFLSLLFFLFALSNQDALSRFLSRQHHHNDKTHLEHPPSLLKN